MFKEDMTDKQIIIDGCDVRGCDACSYNMDGCFYECKVKGFYVNCCYIDCEDNPNCYYKQLKRKEQECEMLKEKILLKINECEVKNEKKKN